MARTVQLILTVGLDDGDERSPEDVRRDVEADLFPFGPEVTLPG